MAPEQDGVIVARRRAYGVEYLDIHGDWTVFLDEAYPYQDRTRAESICQRQGGTMVVTKPFARMWAGVGSQDVMLAAA